MKEKAVVLLITVHRDSHGRYWMEEEEVHKLAGDMEEDSSKTFEVRRQNHE